MNPPIVARRLAELRATVAAWRAAGLSVGLVPTMGALHRGHASLVEHARAKCDRVIVSIFVNPTQFGPNEDLDAYPRREAEDLALLGTLGVDLAWTPLLDEMYPAGFSTRIAVGPLAQGLCGPFRPGHFDGVATVVTKLLDQTQATSAYFGEKDYQQLLIVRRVARDLDLPVDIVGLPTIREPDGLALSSRNAYLSPAGRAQAAVLIQVLRAGAAAARAADPPPVERILADSRARLSAAGFDAIDYVAICDAETLEPVETLSRPARMFAAARIGATRLIDNVPID
jgi:pantoate--beta-alanine ligase